MTYGFVYILANDYMRDVIKIGCTERSPLARAEELSKPTGVPYPFRVLCYIEIEDFQRVERDVHERLVEHRISPNREFFHGCLNEAVALLWWWPERRSFCDATWNTGASNETELLMMLGTRNGNLVDLSQLPKPWDTFDQIDDSALFERTGTTSLQMHGGEL